MGSVKVYLYAGCSRKPCGREGNLLFPNTCRSGIEDATIEHNEYNIAMKVCACHQLRSCTMASVMICVPYTIMPKTKYVMHHYCCKSAIQDLSFVEKASFLFHVVRVPDAYLACDLTSIGSNPNFCWDGNHKMVQL